MLSPSLTALFALYALLITPLLLLSHSLYFFRLSSPHPPLPVRIYKFLAPAIRFQLRQCGHSSPPPASSSQPLSFSPTLTIVLKLSVICLVSPLYAVFIAVSAYIAGAFWVFAEILRDPVRSKAGGDEDGRRAVESVKRWWVRWLERGLR